MPVPRRRILAGATGLGVLTAAHKIFGPLPPVALAEPSGRVHGEFPSHDPDLVRETVAASHVNVDRVRELVTARPALAKAAWDWGFGDWESALGAASHMGRRDIAELLLEHGARPDLFSAAMLGQLEVIRGFVEAVPGIQGTPGPHGITLLAHAKAGGEAAVSVVRYLEQIGGADVSPPSVEIDAAARERYVGTYDLGVDPPFEVTIHRSGSLRIARGERPGRVLIPVTEHTFRPGGAEAVRVRFEMEGDRAVGLRVLDPDVLATAVRVR